MTKWRCYWVALNVLWEEDALPQKSHICSSGVLPKPGPLPKSHALVVLRAAFFGRFTSRAISWGRRNLAMVVFAPVTSRLDCCNTLCVGLFFFLMAQKLQQVQNAASRLLAEVQETYHTTTVIILAPFSISRFNSKCSSKGLLHVPLEVRRGATLISMAFFVWDACL